MKELEELTWQIQMKLPRLMYAYYNKYSGEILEWHPIMLNDVLEWYDEHTAISKNGVEGFYTRGFYDEFEDWIEWDLSKPYLKDQSPELITFLHGLINH